MIGVSLIVIAIVGYFYCKKRIEVWDRHAEKSKKTVEEFTRYESESKSESELELIRNTRKLAQDGMYNAEANSRLLKTFMYVCMGLIVLGILFTGLEVRSSQEKDTITKEEKEWLEDNLGDGKYEEIQDAIDDYKNR